MQIATTACGNYMDHEYRLFLNRIQQRFSMNVQNGEPLFTTNVDDLFRTYLESFPEGSIRQYHNCRTCQKFIDRFGRLVTVSPSGQLVPAMWHVDDAPPVYRAAIAAMSQRLRKATITGVFYSSESAWGTPRTSEWIHFAIVPPEEKKFHTRFSPQISS